MRWLTYGPGVAAVVSMASVATATGLVDQMLHGRTTVLKVDATTGQFMCVEHRRWTAVDKRNLESVGPGDIVRVERAPSSVALCVQSLVLVQQSRRRIARCRPVQGANDAEPWRLDNQIDQHGDPICPACSQAILPASSVGHLDSFMVHLRCWLAG